MISFGSSAVIKVFVWFLSSLQGCNGQQKFHMSVYGALPQGSWQRFFLSGITDLWAVFCRFVWVQYLGEVLGKPHFMFRYLSLVVNLIILACIIIKEIADWFDLLCNCWSSLMEQQVCIIPKQWCCMVFVMTIKLVYSHHNVVSTLISMVFPSCSGGRCASAILLITIFLACNFCGHSRSGHEGCICSV